MPPIITLLTDFGVSDTYVGQLKGAILAIEPGAMIVDLTHEVAPQAVRQGAFLLETAIAAFPSGTIHVAVVDPGVGTGRRALALRAERAFFVGPDNGLLSAALPEAVRPAGDAAAPTAMPSGVIAVEASNPAFHRPVVSATFHGRDLFGPVAAHLARGVPVERFGPAVDRIVAFPAFRARRVAGGVVARIIAIDRFGNLILDARADDLPDGPLVARAGGHRVAGPVTTYAGAGGLTLLIGSGGYWEIALPNGSAAARTGARLDDPVEIHVLPL